MIVLYKSSSIYLFYRPRTEAKAKIEVGAKARAQINIRALIKTKIQAGVKVEVQKMVGIRIEVSLLSVKALLAL